MINCFHCVHFFVTYDRHFPRGCRAWQFKTSEVPSVAIQKNTGHPCPLFQDNGKGEKK